ncbi:MAG: DUF86 domain-containing protein [Nanoarchaeota archaeon]
MEFKDRVLLKLRDMEKYVEELEEFVPSDIPKYKKNLMVKRSCEKTAELVIEAALDVVAMIVSKKKLGIPQNEDDLIQLLIDNNVVSSALGKKLKQMKGFRNLLVHKYGTVDDDKSYQYFAGELGDFGQFSREIKCYLQKAEQ